MSDPLYNNPATLDDYKGQLMIMREIDEEKKKVVRTISSPNTLRLPWAKSGWIVKSLQSKVPARIMSGDPEASGI